MERAAYRIIDANFNRAREALRVIEDYCRFCLNCEHLSGRAKDMRHRLSTIIAKVDAGQLLANRDTPGDVGVGQTTKNVIGRGNLKDSLTAACKRLPEALRVIAETLKSDKPQMADDIEKLRYDSYTIEKDIVLFADAQSRFNKVHLYVIISSNLPADIFSLTNQCIQGKADCIQLRAKDLDAEKYFEIAAEFVKMCRDAGVLSIINDRVDIAIAAGADGVHLGQNDLPIEQARKLQLKPLILGKSTHSIKELKAAIEERPAYVSLGPIFKTPTKPDIKVAGMEYVEKGLPILTDTGIAYVGIGGINGGNIEKVLTAGVTKVAVSSAVTASKNPKNECKKLKYIIEGYLIGSKQCPRMRGSNKREL